MSTHRPNITKLLLALAPLVAIAKAFDDSRLNKGIQPWGKGNDGVNPTEVILLSDQDDSTLLTLAHCLAARDAAGELGSPASRSKPELVTRPLWYINVTKHNRGLNSDAHLLKKKPEGEANETACGTGIIPSVVVPHPSDSTGKFNYCPVCLRIEKEQEQEG